VIQHALDVGCHGGTNFDTVIMRACEILLDVVRHEYAHAFAYVNQDEKGHNEKGRTPPIDPFQDPRKQRNRNGNFCEPRQRLGS